MALKPLKISVLFRPDAPVGIFDDPRHDPVEIYYAPISRGIKERAASTQVELTPCYLPPFDWLTYVEANRPDGLILLASGLADQIVVRDLVNAGVACVALGTSPSLACDNSLPCIDTENRQSGVLAARHLLELGHRRIACVNLSTSFSNHSDRMLGFSSTLEAAGCPLMRSQLVLNPDYNYLEFAQFVTEWLEERIATNSVPTAIFACDFNMVDAVLIALATHDIAVPEHVSVIGFDDPPVAGRLNPPLTTLRQPAYEMGVRAVDRLVDALRADGGPRLVTGTERMPAELIVRGTTAPPRD